MAEVHYNLGTVFQDQCLLADAVACYRRVLELKPDHTVAHSNLLMNIQYDAAITPEDLLRESTAWEKAQLAGTRVMHRPQNDPDPARRLRIGYVSGDLRRHPVGYFLDGVLACHDPEQFRVHCYANQSFGDDLTERLRANSARWQAIFGKPDEEVAEMIRADGIDILVDLAGHTARNRLTVFGIKPAPVQATWAGYVGTTGLSAMDYLISDNRETPEGTDHWYVESIMRLPDCYVCYAPPDYAPPVAPLPAARNGFITFGCFNNLAKINPEVIGLWTELLRNLPDARLLMVTKALGDPRISRRYRDAFDAGGVGGSVDFSGMVPHRELLERYGDVDVALDPFPYSGGLTTLESLWMGVPVVTLGGERFASRHTLSHLAAAGLHELIADDRAAYVAKAVSLAGDLPRLQELRLSMRDRLAASPLCDAPRFTRNLEQAYRSMWRKWCLESSQAERK
jgi:predicted O-linked N-acetylglucosamine transferase (SPINDLY family)